MKKIITNFIPWIVIAIMLVALIPTVARRVSNEENNKNVTVSILYNNLRNIVSKEKIDEVLDGYQAAGVNTISIMEEDINACVARGEVTCIKLNAMLHKYDEESMQIAKVITDNYPSVSYDSHIILTKREKYKELLAKFIPMKYNEEDYVKIEGVEGVDIYAFYNGRNPLWNISLGYDESIIKEFFDRGFEISLVHTLRNYKEQAYLDYIDYIVKKYDVKFLNLKETSPKVFEEEEIKANYEGIADIINNNDMTLVVTENTDQLSNQKFFGYGYVFDKVMSDEGSNKVVRSYETYDDSQDDGSHYKFRANQFFNSTIDRNIRFISVTQISSPNVPYDDCADFTLKATTEYVNRIKNSGFTVNGEVKAFDYPSSSAFPKACCAVIMVMLALVVIELIMKKKSVVYTIAALVVAALAFVATPFVPAALQSLYPSVYCVVISSFAMTVVLSFVKKMSETKIRAVPLAIVTVLLALLTLAIGLLGMGAMLSGIDYYINNSIFRGIKLSLLVPLAYTLVMYYVLCYKKTEASITRDITKVLTADIKVYWIIIGAVFLCIGMYYITRSGNVNSISSIEQAMRNLITEIFPARPRTKEFLIGYPALVLFCYYFKKDDLKILAWPLAVAASILAASVTNSFCHVFTDLSVIYMRVVNGLLLGVFVSVAAYVGNLIVLKLFYFFKKKYVKALEMK